MQLVLTKTEREVYELMEVGRVYKRSDINHPANTAVFSLKKKGLVKRVRSSGNTLRWQRIVNPKPPKLSKVQGEVYQKILELAPNWVTDTELGCKYSTLNSLYNKGYVEGKLIDHLKYNGGVMEFRVPPTLENMGVDDRGYYSIVDIPSGIPINCRYTPDSGNYGEWVWIADHLYSDTSITYSAYCLISKNKSAIIWAVKKYIAPIYEQAAVSLAERGVIGGGDG